MLQWNEQKYRFPFFLYFFSFFRQPEREITNSFCCIRNNKDFKSIYQVDAIKRFKQEIQWKKKQKTKQNENH